MEMDNDSGQSSHKRKLHQVLPGGSLKGTSSRKLVKMTSMSSAAAGHTSYTTTTTTTTTTSDNVASQLLLLQEEDQQQQQCHHHKKLQSSSSFTQTGKSTFTGINTTESNCLLTNSTGSRSSPHLPVATAELSLRKFVGTWRHDLDDQF
ncbi:unnamed protein product [Sphagnum jensenii]|uniref:Uncharacterized protein n=1 Tax=Sphagnum jensenii TaxID=128206 RepID=A0ABP1B6L0_9BRYO